MPLIVLSGYPCSGKTTRKDQLQEYFRETRPNIKIHVISDDSLNVDRNKSYATINEEKKVRGAILSAVDRYLTKKDLVILDAMNYISGFRYQLFCIARSCGTTLCLIHCNISTKEAKSRNNSCLHYQDTLFEELIMRYEEPNPNKRWDTPLFTINPDDDLLKDMIEAALFEGKKLVPNLATRKVPITDTNYLYELDRIVKDVINEILEAQKMGLIEIYPTRCSHLLHLDRPISMPELQRHRHHFVQMNKILTVTDVSKVIDLFVDYLNNIHSHG